MSSIIHQLKSRIAEISTPHMPKGELWLGTQVLETCGLDDTVDNHFRLADRLNHAMVCLSVAEDGMDKPDLGYRYVSCGDVYNAVKTGDRPVFAVVDGPFQNLVNTMGMMDVLTGWVTARDEIIRAYNHEMNTCLSLIDRILKQPPSAMVITDDMAFDNGPLVSPGDMDTLCSSFYAMAVPRIHECGIPVFLHSCGNIGKLIPVIQSWGIDGFSAIQSGLNDLENLYRQFDSGIMIMGGIENDLLETHPFSGESEKKLGRLLAVFGNTGDLILGSSCGLYKQEHLEQIQRIYTLADQSH